VAQISGELQDPQTRRPRLASKFAVFENQDAIHARSDRVVVGNDDETRLQFLVKFKHQPEYVFTVTCIEVASRLVGQHQLRSCN